jgi:hypothetical protein
MKLKDKLLILLPSILSLAAALTYFAIGSPPAFAMCGGDNSACVYAGQCYSNGACVPTGCTVNGTSQLCHNGSLEICGSC